MRCVVSDDCSDGNCCEVPFCHRRARRGGERPGPAIILPGLPLTSRGVTPARVGLISSAAVVITMIVVVASVIIILAEAVASTVFLPSSIVKVVLIVIVTLVIIIVGAVIFRDDSLESCGRRLQSEHHDHRDEDASFHYKHRFFLIIGVHPDVVITAEPIQKAKHLRECVQYVVRKREGKCIPNGDDIQLPVVDAYPDFPVVVK